MRTSMPKKAMQIDREKLRQAIRKLGHEDLLDMLDDALDWLPEPKLRKVVGKHVDLKQVYPDTTKAKSGLLKDIKRFHKASLSGKLWQAD